MVFDLMSVGEDLARWGFVEARAKCPMCGKEDLPTHWMYCSSDEVKQVLADMFVRSEDKVQHTFITAVMAEIRRTHQ